MVKALDTQCENIEGLRYEIIVADDGSTDEHLCHVNKEILELENARYIQRKENVGRAGIRNFLAKEASYEWILFIDSDMTMLLDDFILHYAELDNSFKVAYGGYQLGNGTISNLRYLYEKNAANKNAPKHRNQNPYSNLHTANLLMNRQTALTHPFDERFKRYGYEDVLLGKRLQEAGISIVHIDNPLLFDKFESNNRFMQKTEEAMQTLYMFRTELQGFSPLLDMAQRMKRLHLQSFFLSFWKARKDNWRIKLCGNHPNLKLYMLYKLGYFISLF